MISILPILALGCFGPKIVALPAQTDAKLSTTFEFTQATLDRMYDRGFTDADHKFRLRKMEDRFRRGIGSIRTAPLHSETVSFLWLVDEALVAYEVGYRARQAYLSQSEIDKAKAPLIEKAQKGPRRLYFSGLLSIQPSFGGFGGRMDRKGSPDELKGVRVVLKVGDKIYQPEEQPGDLTPKTEKFVESDSELSPGFFGNYYSVTQTKKYETYNGYFKVAFDLFEPDGTPRITEKDKTITAVVIYGSNERSAEYNLKDVSKALE